MEGSDGTGGGEEVGPVIKLIGLLYYAWQFFSKKGLTYA
jgi:hypothetical protein